MKRKEFITISALGVLATFLVKWYIQKKKTIVQKITGTSFQHGHTLKNHNLSNQPPVTEKIQTIIVGGGVSGLSTAWYLQKNKYSDFCLLEMESDAGGNTKYGQHGEYFYPLGAHYLPQYSTDFPALLDFLKEIKYIVPHAEKWEANKEHLTHEPEERLFIRSEWQYSLIPETAISVNDKKEFQRFLKSMQEYAQQKGQDGLSAFQIPVLLSSRDQRFLDLDQITMQNWLQQHNYNSEKLLWYVNYCCLDDFGIGIDKVSAWAAIHYFAARSVSKNISHQNAVFSSEKGNGFLTDALQKNISKQIRKKHLVKTITKNGAHYTIEVMHIETGKTKLLETENLVLAVPQFVLKHMLPEREFNPHLHFVPWAVHNFHLNLDFFRQNTGFAWDNVLYGSKNLGYIYNNNQQLNPDKQNPVLTFYEVLTGKDEKETRKKLLSDFQNKTVSYADALKDMERMHPGISGQIDQVHTHVWAHGMPGPAPGAMRKAFEMADKKNSENIFFVHTDRSGISIFENAFYQGTNAARQILKSYEIRH